MAKPRHTCCRACTRELTALRDENAVLRDLLNLPSVDGHDLAEEPNDAGAMFAVVRDNAPLPCVEVGK